MFVFKQKTRLFGIEDLQHAHISEQFKFPYSWLSSHTQVPVVDFKATPYPRMYFSCRDEKGKSRIFALDFQLVQNNFKIIKFLPEPILSLGALGTFDDAGVMPTSIVHQSNRIFLYYIGWMERVSVPYQNSVGVAVSDDGGKSFRRLFEGPILSTNPYDPYFTGTAFVMPFQDFYRAYYLSAVGWVGPQNSSERPEPRYHLKYVDSENGIHFSPKGKVALSLKSEKEGGLASASLIPMKDGFGMWFCHRSTHNYRNNAKNAYRIGFAFSQDGDQFERIQENIFMQEQLVSSHSEGVADTESSWESIMQAYPYVVDDGEQILLFYNGNGFGQSGVGLAICTRNM